ncbi:MAG: RsmB/NOP family class I SAM-dependent RNA methyltransferase [Burkholderiales bacterium]
MQPFSRAADKELQDLFRAERELGAGDRAFVAETVYGVVRHLRSLMTLTQSSDSRALVLAALVKYLGRNVRELAPWVSESEASQLAEIKAADLGLLPPAVSAELPDWLYSRLSSIYPETELSAMMRALNRPAPLDLRVNTLLAERNEVLAQLQAEGIAASATPYSPFGIRLASHPAINRHRLFLEGKVEVQDEAGQLACVLVAPKPRDFVVDFCAGAGGKTLCLGALMRSHGRIYAFDVSAKRLAKFSPRLKRSGLSNVHVKVIESEAQVQRLAGKIDRVLVDAPCSGLGTLRRNPDLKWRQSPQSVAELTQKQAAILQAASRLVKDGGRLVYATCSILPEENDAIVAGFLESKTDFSLIACGKILAGRQIPLDTGEMLRLFSHRHGTDGFFAAVIERRIT